MQYLLSLSLSLSHTSVLPPLSLTLSVSTVERIPWLEDTKATLIYNALVHFFVCTNLQSSEHMHTLDWMIRWHWHVLRCKSNIPHQLTHSLENVIFFFVCSGAFVASPPSYLSGLTCFCHTHKAQHHRNDNVLTLFFRKMNNNSLLLRSHYCWLIPCSTENVVQLQIVSQMRFVR